MAARAKAPTIVGVESDDSEFESRDRHESIHLVLKVIGHLWIHRLEAYKYIRE